GGARRGRVAFSVSPYRQTISGPPRLALSRGLRRTEGGAERLALLLPDCHTFSVGSRSAGKEFRVQALAHGPGRATSRSRHGHRGSLAISGPPPPRGRAASAQAWRPPL